MLLHLVGGFLGSGKTTAIVQAAQLLISEGLKVGVMTNDQGKYLVDTAFVRLADLPTVEVTGGCFCCNYDDLNERLLELIGEIEPDVVFAESVGSCADIVATVVKPLLEIGDERIKPSSYSVFVDSRLLLYWLEEQTLPFSEDVVYIFEKQIEEAGLLIVNKVDLLDPEERQTLEGCIQSRFDTLPFRFQNSLEKDSVCGWVDGLQAGKNPLPDRSLEIDYDRYGRGEARMAWLDETLVFNVNEGDPREVVIDWLQFLMDSLKSDQIGIGHLKFVLQSGDATSKISFTGVEQTGWQESVPEVPENEVRILVNARVETTAEKLREYFDASLHQIQSAYDVSFSESHVDYFHPGMPKPTHRID